MAHRTGEGALLLYDGSCGFCAASVQFVLAHERARRALRFASLQGELARDVVVRHPALAGIDSLIWYEPASPERARPERVLVRSAAVLEVADYLGGIWRVLGRIGRLIPRPLRDAAYDLFARHRYRVFGRVDACLLPTPAQRARFVDLPG